MDILTAHGRMEFITSEKPEGCVFCRDSIRDENLTLYDDGCVSIMMNKYPYNTGHILIVPNRHIANLEEVTAEERVKIFEELAVAVKILKKVLNPEGFNIGINLGKAGGAGIADHLHLHIVPRWNGDTNFMTCVGDTRVSPEDVNVTCQKLKPAFKELYAGGS
jgi:ATP adenylyltransferase